MQQSLQRVTTLNTCWSKQDDFTKIVFAGHLTLRHQYTLDDNQLSADRYGMQIRSVSSGRPSWLMLLVAIAAINRPGSIGLEGNLTCLSALSARGIVHLSRAAVVAASPAAAASISFHLIHLPLASIPRIDPTTKHPIKLNRIEATLT